MQRSQQQLVAVRGADSGGLESWGVASERYLSSAKDTGELSDGTGVKRRLVGGVGAACAENIRGLTVARGGVGVGTGVRRRLGGVGAAEGIGGQTVVRGGLGGSVDVGGHSNVKGVSASLPQRRNMPDDEDLTNLFKQNSQKIPPFRGFSLTHKTPQYSSDELFTDSDN